MTKKIVSVLLSITFLSSVAIAPVFAEEQTSTKQALIEQLRLQIEELNDQINDLISQGASVGQVKQGTKETTLAANTTLRLLKQLREGMTSEDVKLLQEILATDPDIYPEGLISGYFGGLTKNAVKRFQKIAGLEQVGNVGPKTLSKLNELLAAGAGQSGKVPPGLLIAPGIRKKVDLELLKPLPGQILPPGIAKKITGENPNADVTPPVISSIVVSDITTTSAKITWTTNENATSKVWYGTTTPFVVIDTTPSVSLNTMTLSHTITLSGLTVGTVYYFIASSTDEADNNEISDEKTFTTLAQ